MMMMTTGRIPECRAAEGAVLAMAMTFRTARVRRTHRAVGKGPGKGRVQRIARGQGRGRQQRKGRGSGREMVKGKVLLNKRQEEMISLVPWLCGGRRKCMRQTQTRRAN
jgi:hypothetical protein